MSTSDARPGPALAREEALFQAAAALSATARVSFLDGACLGDPALRQRLESLLAAHEDTDTLLATQAETARPAPDHADAPDEAVGQTLGRYKLLERVGEGGCGVVYVAEQTEPVRRRVALKVIKLGMDTKQVVARFEAERQALAMMDHPNIAKVLDAGTTDVGRPFFVMELVRGIRITDYCDQANLSTKDRLDLFIKVCQAIQHAHQKGIIHRDIKPSNILVTLHDGVPVPKVIDFGIAKATEGRLTDNTVYTQLHQFIGTPAYMSPEQAEMSGLDIDTRSDIYSLGVLLYELLAGSTPFDARELMSQGIDAMRKTIREKEPQRPSTKLSQTLVAADVSPRKSTSGLAIPTAEEISADSRRRLRLKEQIARVKGDLDWIVMKCLEKDRQRRYDTANGLAADLKRHLNNEPVVARPPSAAYKFQKAFRRNKLVFSAAAAVAAALLVGVSASVWQAARATRAKMVADAASSAAKASEQKARDAEAGQTLLREQAEAQALAARRIAYSSDINLAQQALAMNNLGRARMLLNRQKPGPGQADLRGWEWRYLWSQTRADEHEVFFAGTNRLGNMAFSGDGRLLVWEFEGELVVTDLISRRTVLQRTNSWRPAFAHQAVLLAFVSTISPTNGAITLLDIATKKETQIETSWANTRWLGFTPDHRRLLTVSRRPEARRTDQFPLHLTAWEVSSGKLLWQRPLSAPETGLGRPYALSPDGNLFAAATPDGRFQVLDSASGNERISVKATPEHVTALTFSPDGKAVLSGAGFTDSAIQIWDSHSGTNLGTLEGHRSWVSDLVFTPDATRLISSSADQTVRLWDWPMRKSAGILRGHLDGVDGVALAPDGRTLASRCIDGSVYLWDLTKPSRKVAYETFPGGLVTRGAVFTPDSRSILAVERNGGAILLDAFTLTETRRLWGNSTNRYAITISPDASRVIYGWSEGRVHVWDAHTGMESTNFIAASSSISVGLTADGKFLLTFLNQRSTSDALADVWSTDSWKRQGSIKVKHDDVRGIYTPALPNSLVIRTPGALQFFDVTKPDQAPRQIEGQGQSYDVAASPDGRTVAVAYAEGFVRLWDMTTLQKVDSVKGFLLGAHSVAFSPDGKRLAAGSNGLEAVKLWDTETRQEVLTLSGEGSMFRPLKFSPDGRFLLAVNAAGLAHLWSAPSWEEIAATEQKESRQP